LIETELLSKNYYVYRWRQVPINTAVLGIKAENNRPEITQVIFKSNNKNLTGDDLERDLFVIRKKIEKQSNILSLKDFYICSFSSRSIVYKGMFLAEALSEFYPDLMDKRFISKFAIFHQRYSTNTFPSWDLAQPFRVLAHNGEINTLKGNINWMKIHEQDMNSKLFDDIEALRPVIAMGNSDSAALDNVFELLVRSGKSVPLTKLMLIPDAWSKRRKTIPKTHQQLFNVLNSIIEPWDGPAAIAASDGKWIIAATDRNGLRPLRYTVSSDKLLFAGSETGMVPIPNDKIVFKGRLGPGQVIAVNLDKGKVYDSKSIKNHISKDYKKYNKQIIDLDKKFDISKEKFIYSGDELRRRQYLAGINIEDLELILHPMVEEAKEATGSMGDDTPSAVLSDRYRPISHFFRQNFSQVTNPPIDSLRENEVMSLKTRFGNLGNILDFENLTKDNIYVLESPILSNSQHEKFMGFFSDSVKVLDCTFGIQNSLKESLDELSSEAEVAVREGYKHLILSDKQLSENRTAIPMILAFGVINSKLVNLGIRSFASINIQTGEALDTHSFAVLLGIGATTINPYLAFDSIYQRYKKKLFSNLSYEECVQRYIKSVDNGLLKIMSKMGISVLSAYRGGCNFETVGLSRAVVAEYFPGMISRISGIGILGIEKKIKELHKKAFQKNLSILPIGGFYKYRKSGENHQYQGQLIHELQHAVAVNSYEAYKKYAQGIYNLPVINLRDLLAFKSLGKPINISEVESVANLRKRFGSGSMSHGALSAEAHETLSIGMNRIGAASCSGEGGEDPKRFIKMKNGDSSNSKIKQVASARFGVTIEYLNNCNEIEIKIAQGAKPGEGGQLPGFKVSKEI
ncbi:MAG: glutamate synthase large subunit, partial [Pelagibacteraceae bacterium]|nr:glutamate synthase large subunit [Pelagibacteraceae bacterium]